MTTHGPWLVGDDIRIGCDVTAVAEIVDSLDRFGDRFVNRVFTADEVVACAGPDRSRRLAARFAAKEAVVKALELGDVPTPPHEIEVIGAGGAPRLQLHGSIADHARRAGWDAPRLSLSHTDCHAMAMVAVRVSEP